MPYPYHSNNQYYMQELQAMRDRIDSQIRQQQNQMQQPAPITQNFQITPQNNNGLESKYVENIDDVKNTFVMKTGIFVNKDFSTLWVKDYTGNIRTFKTEEIIEIDEKDKEIYALKKEIEEMKGMINNAKSDNTNVDGENTTSKSKRISSSTKSNAK